MKKVLGRYGNNKGQWVEGSFPVRPVFFYGELGGKIGIAGRVGDAAGPAHTFTPINMWDVRLKQCADVALALPEGHTSILVVLSGQVSVNGDHVIGDAEALLLDTAGHAVSLAAGADTVMLVLTGEPIDEPIVGRGPFVMNSQAEIAEAPPRGREPTSI